MSKKRKVSFKSNIKTKKSKQCKAVDWFNSLGTTIEKKSHEMLVCQATKTRNAAITLLEMKNLRKGNKKSRKTKRRKKRRKKKRRKKKLRKTRKRTRKRV